MTVTGQLATRAARHGGATPPGPMSHISHIHHETLARDRSPVYLSSPKVTRTDSMHRYLDTNPVRAGAAPAGPVPSCTGGRTPVRVPVAAFGSGRTAPSHHPYALVRRPMR